MQDDDDDGDDGQVPDESTSRFASFIQKSESFNGLSMSLATTGRTMDNDVAIILRGECPLDLDADVCLVHCHHNTTASFFKVLLPQLCNVNVGKLFVTDGL